MDLSNLFKLHLISLGSSPATVKNYVADVRRFIRYFENKYSLPFKPDVVTWEMVHVYRQELTDEIGQRSVDRHISSLRRFFQFTIDQGLSKENPCLIQPPTQEATLDSEARLKEFKDYLYRNRASDLTIKNYIIDVRQFLSWFELVSTQDSKALSPSQVIKSLAPQVLATYKHRLVHDSDLSVSSINRKLSSLRTYFRWAIDTGTIDQTNISENIKNQQLTSVSNLKETMPNDPLLSLYAKQYKENQAQHTQTTPDSEPKPTYSRIPPVRLIQKIVKGTTLTMDFAIVTPLAHAASFCQYVLWTQSGEKLFEAISQSTPVSQIVDRADALSKVSNIKSSFYTPLPSALSEEPLHRRLLFHMANTRPVWYRKYQSVPFARVLHTGVLISVIAVSLLLLYNHTLAPQTAVLGDSNNTPPRTLSFKGVLADENGLPITDTTGMRFSLYTNPVASGEAQLWEEVQHVTPDDTGNFIVVLGKDTPIPQSIFLEGVKLYVGVSVGPKPELSPRQPIANVALAKDTQTLQGLLPITDPQAETENVILALDSSGNLTLGGNKSHTFQSTGGDFQIRGQNVILSTLRGTDGSISLRPDGTGVIDVGGPIQNTSEPIIDDELAGAVQIEDLLAVNAASSQSAALSINQNSFGPLISASSAGSTRFLVDTIGTTTIGHNLKVNGTDIASSRPVFGLLNRNVAIVNFAGESEAVTIGSHSGTTTIRNARTAIRGDLTISGPIGATFFGKGSGITFSGSGNHTIRASSGNLKIGSTLRISEGSNIIPDTTNGINNLGSEEKPFDTLYVQNIVSPSLDASNGNITSFFERNLGILKPRNITDDIILGGTATSSAVTRFGGTVGSDSFFNTGGNVGIGTTSPFYRLHVSQNQSTDAVALIENTNTGVDAEVLKLKIGAIPPGSSNTFINFLNGTGTSSGAIRATGSPTAPTISYETSGSDFAEYFKKESPEETMATGDIVCLGDNGGVTRCDETNTTIIGVITDRAGFVGASDKDGNPDYVLVGLHGQIPVRVLASEHISPGDSLTVSHLKGVVEKTNDSGQIIGRALEASRGKTTVLAYINPTWHDPNVSVTDTGNLSIVPLEGNDDGESESYLVMDTISNKVLGSIGVFSDVVTGSVKAGFINAKEVFVEGGIRVGGTLATSALEAGEISARTMNATETLVAGTIQAEAVQSERIVAPIVETERIKVSILSPVSDDALTVHLRNRRVEFVNSQRPNEPVASIDEDGNASFEGELRANEIESSEVRTATLAAETLTVSDNASVSGTLVVKELIAEKLKLPQSTIDELIETLENEVTEEIASLLAQGASPAVISEVLAPVIGEQNQTNDTHLATSEQLATPSAETIAHPKVNTSYSDSASISALAQFVPDLTANRVSINQGLMVFGVTSLLDAAVSDLLSIGGNMTIQDGAINTLGTDLQIQPLRQGDISLMAGRIMIDTDGNAVFSEDVTIEGTLFANTIKPQEETLTVSLDENKSFTVASASTSAGLTINSIGDLVASGSGNFLDLIAKNFKVVRGVEADTSSTETIASGSAGVASIVPGEIERTVSSPFITEDSLVYLTPASETYGMTPYVARQTVDLPQNPSEETGLSTSGGSFTIRIQDPLPNEVKVNWWIIN